jgi:OOP family OmpA-OmpF porin
VAANLVEAAKAVLTSDVVRTLAANLGDNPEHLEAAFAAGIPAILAGLLQKVSSGGGGELVAMLQHDPPELKDLGGLDGVLGNLGGLLSGESAERLIAYGHALVDGLFGGKLHSVADAIARSTGVDSGRASSLLAMLAPVVMGILKKEAAAHGFSAAGLTDVLKAQKDQITQHAPPGLAAALGLNSLGDLGRAADSLAAAGAGLAHGAKSAPRLRWVAAVAALALIAIGYLFFFRGSKEAVQEEGAAANTSLLARHLPKAAVRNMMPGGKDTAKTVNGKSLVETTGKLITLDLPGDTKLAVPEGSYLVAMFAEIKGGLPKETKTFVADDLTFEGTPPKVAEDSSVAINNLALFFKALGTAKLKIEGHSDNVGDSAASKKSALAQATAVKDALVAAGVPADRITAEGIGPDRPIAPNDTEEGRAKNRRIELSIVAP